MVAGGIGVLFVAMVLLVVKDGDGVPSVAGDTSDTLGVSARAAAVQPIADTVERRLARNVGETLAGVEARLVNAALYLLAERLQPTPTPAPTKEPKPTVESAPTPAAAPRPQPQVSIAAACPETSIGGFALSLFYAINSERTSRGIPALEPNFCVTYVAQIHANDMARRAYFAHLTPEGGSVFDWLGNYGIPFAWAGENLARNDYSGDQTVAIALRDLMASPSHRSNILSANYHGIGVAVAAGGGGMKYYSMVFVG